MPAFFLSLLACLLLTAGARDQQLMAGLSARLNSPMPLLVIGVLVAAISAGVAVVAAMAIAQFLTPPAKLMLLAITLLMGAVELFWQRRSITPKEPTRSLTAITLVLLFRQITDGARFVLFGVAVFTGEPLLAALGGTLGGAVALALAWSASDNYDTMLPWRAIRIALAVALLIAAAWLGLSARGLIA